MTKKLCVSDALSDKRGFTLIEMIISIAIVAVLAGTTVGVFGYLSSGNSKKSAAAMKSLLTKTQTEDMTKSGYTYLYVYRTSDGIIAKQINTANVEGHVSGDAVRADTSAYENIIGGERVTVTARGTDSAGNPKTYTIDDSAANSNNMLKIGYVGSSGAYRYCCGVGETGVFYDEIEISGENSSKYIIKNVKKTGKHFIK